MRPFTKHPLSLLITASLLTASGAALAQDNKTEKELLEEITVTATKRNASVADVPFNISAIGEQELRKRNITDLKKLLQDSVEISSPGNSSRFADSVTVRGLNVSPVNQNNLEQFVRTTMAYYLDDTPLPNLGYRIKDIARVETLLGPQGTLYGSGSLGGTIRYITNKPDFDAFSGDVNVSLFAADGGGLSSDTDVVINLPLTETLALRGSLAYLEDAGFTDRAINPVFRDGQDGNPAAWQNPNGSGRSFYKDDDNERTTTGKIALAWKASERLKFTLTHATQDQWAHGSMGSTNLSGAILDDKSDYQYGRDVVVGAYEEYADRSFSMNVVDIEWDLGFANLESSTSDFDDSRVGQANYPVGFLYYGDWGWSELQPANTDQIPYMVFDNTYTGFSHETRLVSQTDGPLSWIGGIYYTEQKKNLRFAEIFPTLDQVSNDVPLGWADPIDRADVGGLVDSGYAEDINSDYSELALFGELTFAITEKWDITAGGRIFNYKDVADPVIRDYAFQLVDTKGALETESKGERFFKLNTSYRFTDDVLAYATASQGFRRGGINGFKDVGNLTIAKEAQNYQPDYTNNYELGAKVTLLDSKLYLQANVYRIDWKDTQTYFDQTLNGFPLNGTANGPDAKSQGFEFSSRYALTDEIGLTYKTATTDGEFTSTKTVCVYEDSDAECDTWEKGAKLGGAPKWKHNAGITFDTAFDNGVGLSAGLRATYTGEIQRARGTNPNDPVEKYDAYTLVNADIGLNTDSWDLRLWADNLANTRSQTSYQSEHYIGTRIIHTRPRTIGMNLSYHW